MSSLNSKIALIGNPNSGKSTLFNLLTGLSQQIGNFPGVTVDKKIGTLTLSDGRQVSLVDFPGLYSLYPNSSDERLVVDILTDPDHRDYPDLVIYVADSNQLDKHLLLATQLIDLGLPLIFAANMSDVSIDKNKILNSDLLSTHLGVPVVSISARKSDNIDQLKEIISDWVTDRTVISPGKPLYQMSKADLTALAIVGKYTDETNPYRSKVIAHHAQWLSRLSPESRAGLCSGLEEIGFADTRGQIDETLQRYTWIEPLVGKVQEQDTTVLSRSERLDAVLTHRVMGPMIFFVVMLFVFQAIYSWSEWPMTLIEDTFVSLGELSRSYLPEGWIADLIADGILAGLGGVLVFIPQILILFFLIGVLEELGYMSRVVFMFDGLLRRFGLNGRSIVALISSSACAIPAIMSTRTISNWKERLITIMVTPFISCSARIPVYTVLVGFVVPSGTWLGFNHKGLAFMGLYLLGIFAALFAGWVFKQIIQPEGQSFLMIELPSYKPPRWRNVLMDTMEKVWTFIIEAGKIILLISILLWVLASYGPADSMARVESEVMTQVDRGQIPQGEADNVIASRKLEASYIGVIGKAIEPVMRPLGYDWKMSIAVLTSFAAREVFIGTMATLYSLGDSGEESSIRDKMAAEINPSTGGKRYDTATALSLLLFYVFAMQCMSTLAVTKRETKSWKWPIIQFVFMTGVAYVAALLAYQLLS